MRPAIALVCVVVAIGCAHEEDACQERLSTTQEDEATMDAALDHVQRARNVLVLSGAGMSTAAGIPDFRSPGGLYSSAEQFIDRATYLRNVSQPVDWQRRRLQDNISNVMTYELFRVNPLPYTEMRRGLIIGVGEGQWKPTIAHALIKLLSRQGKLKLLVSQNVDGLDHRILADESDKPKLYHPHGLVSTLVSEQSTAQEVISTEPSSPVYQKYVELIKRHVRDIYAHLPVNEGNSSGLWPAPEQSTPITLSMLGDALPLQFEPLARSENDRGTFSLKPGTVFFDRKLRRTNEAGEVCSPWAELSETDLVLVMGTSLSGLAIDDVAHLAGKLKIPRIAMSKTDSAVLSMRANGGFGMPRDVFLEGPLDESSLELIDRLGWTDDLMGYLPQLCLSSLRTLQGFLGARNPPDGYAQRIQNAIHEELEREQRYYG